MKTIRNAADWDAFYAYQGKPKVYPKRYPCIAKVEEIDAGVAGFARGHYVTYPPATKSAAEAFVAGLKAQWELVIA